MLQRPIDVLVIELGGNDGLRGLPVKSLKANLQAIIDKAKAKNPTVKIVIAGMQIPPNLGADYAADFAQGLCRTRAGEQRDPDPVPARRRRRPARSQSTGPDSSHRRRTPDHRRPRLANARTDSAQRMSTFRLEGCSALITGASAGIGREFARQLAGRAVSLVLVARRQERLEELRDELTKRDPNLNVHVRESDLSDERAVIDLCDWLEREKLPMDFLINNAGLGDVGPFATSELPTRERNAGRECHGVDAADAIASSRNDRAKARRDSQRQLDGRFSSDRRLCGLCGDESLRHQFFRSDSGRAARHRRDGDFVVSRSRAHGVHPGRGASRRQTRPKLRNSFASPPKKPRGRRSPRSSRTSHSLFQASS